MQLVQMLHTCIYGAGSSVKGQSAHKDVMNREDY